MRNDERKGKKKAKDYYNQQAENYVKQYQEGYEPYPANLIRLDFIVDRLKEHHARTILDAGCGTCGPMIRLLKEGFDVQGFDFSAEMVRHGRDELKKHGYQTNLIRCGDLKSETTHINERFDAILALGVFPHILR